MYSRNVSSWYSDKLCSGPNRGDFPGSNSITWSSSRCGGKRFALDVEKTFARSLYALGIFGYSKDSSHVSSCTCITWKSSGIWVRNPRYNGFTMLSVTVELESRHWIVMRSKFWMRLWCWSQGRLKTSGTSILAEVKRSRTSRCSLNESVICNRLWKNE